MMKLLKPRAVAEMLAINLDQLRALRSSGMIQGVCVSLPTAKKKHYRYHAAEVERFASSGKPEKQKKKPRQNIAGVFRGDARPRTA